MSYWKIMKEGANLPDFFFFFSSSAVSSPATDLYAVARILYWQLSFIWSLSGCRFVYTWSLPPWDIFLQQGRVISFSDFRHHLSGYCPHHAVMKAQSRVLPTVQKSMLACTHSALTSRSWHVLLISFFKIPVGKCSNQERSLWNTQSVFHALTPLPADN